MSVPVNLYVDRMSPVQPVRVADVYYVTHDRASAYSEAAAKIGLTTRDCAEFRQALTEGGRARTWCGCFCHDTSRWKAGFLHHRESEPPAPDGPQPTLTVIKHSPLQGRREGTASPTTSSVRRFISRTAPRSSHVGAALVHNLLLRRMANRSSPQDVDARFEQCDRNRTMRVRLRADCSIDRTVGHEHVLPPIAHVCWLLVGVISACLSGRSRGRTARGAPNP